MAATSEKEAQPDDKSESKHLVVCAIDFGTAYTGLAFSFKSDYKHIFVTKTDDRTYGEKVPTCLLLTKDKCFYRFGYEAEAKYMELCENEEDDDYFYFESFKMKLYETKTIKEDVQVHDVKMNPFPALDIFSMVIKHLVDDIEGVIKLRVTSGLQPYDILWVLTVPAIWSDSAKGFMRKAAVKAGIESEHLILCLEPEAASLYCNTRKSCVTASHDGQVDLKEFPEGQKYIVADLGGGTADLSVHEILPDRHLREIRRSDGGAFGGGLVDDTFFQLLADIFGVNVMSHIRETAFNEILELKAHFHLKKKNFNPFKDKADEKFNIRIPIATLTTTLQELGDEESLEDKMTQATQKYKGKVSFPNKKLNLVLNSAAMEELFAKSVDGIVSFIKDMRKEDELGEINVILLVGGLSSSPYIQKVVRQKIPGLRIFVPEDPSLAVVKGAVLMGHKPKTITEKVARYTYGLSVIREFREGEDPENLKVVQEGQVYCSSIFAKMVEKGTRYKPGDEFGDVVMSHVVRGVQSLRGTLQTEVYRSEETDPVYADEEHGCEVGAVIEMPAPARGWPVRTLLKPKMILGLSEMTVTVYMPNTRLGTQTIESRLEFL